jgi:RNA polymerase sigma factor (TIGR02999 family)
MTDVTRILSAIEQGDPKAADQLLPLIYEDLRKVAAHRLAQERSGQTLQATALVHEAYLRLVSGSDPADEGDETGWNSRGHFFAAAAESMRRILVDHAKSKHRAKRGGDAQFCSLETSDLNTTTALVAGDASYDVVDIDEALQQLAKVDGRLANTIELHYFGGLTCPEIATALSLSEATVHRDLRLAKAFMLKELRPHMDAPR